MVTPVSWSVSIRSVVNQVLYVKMDWRIVNNALSFTKRAKRWSGVKSKIFFTKIPTQKSQSSTQCRTKWNSSLRISLNRSRKSMWSSKYGQGTSDIQRKWIISYLWSTKGSLIKFQEFTWIKYFQKFSWNRIKFLKLRFQKNNFKKLIVKFKLPFKKLANFIILTKNSGLSQSPLQPSLPLLFPFNLIVK